MDKFDNIIKFVSVFLSGDLILVHESPEYIMEKFEQFLGKNITIKKQIRTSHLYKEHNKIWKHDDYRMNSIFNFLDDILKYSKNSEVNIISNGTAHFSSAINNIKCEPKDYVDLFNYWIGDFSDIHNDDNLESLHPVLERDLYDLYLESVDLQYPEFFLKLERKEKLLKIQNDERTL